MTHKASRGNRTAQLASEKLSPGVARLVVAQHREASLAFQPSSLVLLDGLDSLKRESYALRPRMRQAPGQRVERLTTLDELQDRPEDDQKAALTVLRQRHGTRKVTQLARKSGRQDYNLLLPRPLAALSDHPELERLDRALEDDEVYLERRQHRRVLGLNALEEVAVREAFPSLVMEPIVPLYPAALYNRSPYFPVTRPPSQGTQVVVTVTADDDLPVADAQVSVSADGKSAQVQVTDAQGQAEFIVARSYQKVAVLVQPAQTYWSVHLPAVPIAAPLEVRLKPLTPGTPWGRTLVNPPPELGGTGVRVAVIDSGTSHPAITVAGGQSFVPPGTPSDLSDPLGHGTHCAGIIAAQAQGGWTGGVAPHAQLFVYRVFDARAAGGNTNTIPAAIDAAVKAGCDLINLSLSGPVYSLALHNSVKDAFDHGTVCIAAAGNTNPQHPNLGYPAAYAETLAVGALGRRDSYPASSDHAIGEPAGGGGLYVADFSCRGSGLDLIAPGVAVISTVPGGEYVALDGTSMAAPFVTGIAALLLEREHTLLRAPRDRQRSAGILQLVLDAAHDLGFTKDEQGSGCPVF